MLARVVCQLRDCPCGWHAWTSSKLSEVGIISASLPPWHAGHGGVYTLPLCDPARQTEEGT